MTAEPEVDLIEAVSALLEIEQRRAEDLAALRDGLDEDSSELRKAGWKDIAARVEDRASACARMANETAVGIVAMTRLLDAAKTMRISLSSIAGG